MHCASRSFEYKIHENVNVTMACIQSPEGKYKMYVARQQQVTCVKQAEQGLERRGSHGLQVLLGCVLEGPDRELHALLPQPGAGTWAVYTLLYNLQHAQPGQC